MSENVYHRRPPKKTPFSFDLSNQIFKSYVCFAFNLPVLIFAGPMPDCADFNKNCAEWAKIGECSDPRSQAFMSQNCMKSCNQCDDIISTVDQGCTDKSKHCNFWAEKGSCTNHKADFMKRNCAKVCNFC